MSTNEYVNRQFIICCQLLSIHSKYKEEKKRRSTNFVLKSSTFHHFVVVEWSHGTDITMIGYSFRSVLVLREEDSFFANKILLLPFVLPANHTL